MSAAATEQQNNGDVAAVEKIAAKEAAVDAKEDLKSKPAVEETKTAAADNGTASKEAAAAEGKEIRDLPTSPRYDLKEPVSKGTKRPSDAKSAESKKARKEKAADADSDDDDVLDEEIIDSDVESDEYDIPFDGEEDDIECDGDDDYDDASASDDQA